MTQSRILLVDDEESVASTMAGILALDGHDVVTAHSGSAGLELLRQDQFDLVLTDLRLGDLDGLSLVAQVQADSPATVAIVLTGYASLDTAVSALRRGAYDYVIKPCDVGELRATVARALELRHVRTGLSQRVVELERANETLRRLNADLERRVEEATATLNEQLEMLRFLDEASVLLASSLDDEATFHQAVRAAVPRLADWCSVDVVEEGRPPQGLAAAHVDPAKEALVRELQRRYPPDPEGRQPVSEVLRTGRSLLVSDVSERVLRDTSRDAQHFALRQEIGFRSVMVVPMAARERLLGTMTFVRGDAARLYGETDLALAEEFARRCALAIDNARLYREAHEAQSALWEGEARYRRLLELSPAPILVHSEGTIVYANSAAARLVGAERAGDLFGRSMLDLVHPDSRQLVLARMRQTRGSGRQTDPVLDKFVRFDGRVVDVEVVAIPLTYRGRPTTQVVIRDVSEQKQAEDTLRFLAAASKELAESLDYDATVQSMVRLCVPNLADWCLVDLVNEDGSFRRIAVAHADPTKAELARRLQREYGPVSRGATHGIAHVARTGQGEILSDISDELMASFARDPDHLGLLQQLGLRAHICVPLFAHGRTLGTLTLVSSQSSRRFDLGDLRLAEELAGRFAVAIDNARLFGESQKAVQVRDEFLSIAAHELKTPLTSLLTSAQLLGRQFDRETPPDAKTHRARLRTIENQARGLGRLVSQLLDVSSVESGKLTLHTREVDVAGLVVAAAAAMPASTGSAPVVVRAPSPIVACVDPVRIRQVVTNLLDNAVKFSPGGEPIDVDVSAAEPGLVRITVRDQGLGIPPDKREQIFDRFHQAHASEHRSGLGLGLYISRQIVELHGGQITAEFPSDGGTRIVVLLPTARAGAADEHGRSTFSS